MACSLCVGLLARLHLRPVLIAEQVEEPVGEGAVPGVTDDRRAKHDVAELAGRARREPLAQKQAPPNGYAGKFSTPYCIAASFVPHR